MPTGGKLLGLCLGCVALFYVGLHPWSGMIGGLLHLLIGWALPTLCVILLAAGLAWLIPVGTALRVATALALTIPLGLNTSLTTIGEALSYAPVVSSDIRQNVVWRDATSANSVSIKKRSWGPLLVNPAGPQVQDAGDEGCGCMYFVDRKSALYSDAVIDRLSQITGRRANVLDYSSLQDPGLEARDVHIDLNFFQRDNNFRALVEVFDHGVKIAAFAHTNIPLRTLSDATGLGRERIAVNFWPNASDLLLHDNLWSAILNRIAPGYFPQQAFADFIEASMAPRNLAR